MTRNGVAGAGRGIAEEVCGFKAELGSKVGHGWVQPAERGGDMARVGLRADRLVVCSLCIHCIGATHGW